MIGRTDSRSTSTRGGVRNRSALTRVGRRTALWPLHDAPHAGLPTRCGAPSGSAQRTVPPHSGGTRTTYLDLVAPCAVVRSLVLDHAWLVCASVGELCVRAYPRVHVFGVAWGRVVVVRSESRDFMSAAASAPSGPACSRTLGPCSTLLHACATWPSRRRRLCAV